MTSDDSAPQQAVAPRVLTRSSESKIFLGVCSGLGRYTGVDPLVFRVVAAVLTISSTFGGLIYFAAAIAMAPAPGRPSRLERKLKRRLDGDTVLTLLGVVLVVAALLGAAGSFVVSPFAQSPNVKGLTIIVVLTLVLLTAHARGVDLLEAARTLPDRIRNGPPLHAAPPHAAPADQFAAPASDAAPGAVSPSAAPHATGDPLDASPAAGAEPRDALTDGALAAAPYGAMPARWPYFTIGTVLCGAIAAAVMTPAVTAVPESAAPQVLGGAALCAVGVGLVIGGLLGQGRGLIAIGTLLALVLAGTSVRDGVAETGRVGDVSWQPTSVAQLQDPYKISVGDGTLDLTALALTPGKRTVVHAEVGVGELRIVVPRTVRAEVHARAGLGDVTVDKHTSSGPNAKVDTVLQPDGTSGTSATVEIHVKGRIGDLEVSRA